jgi:hypothetical protein
MKTILRRSRDSPPRKLKWTFDVGLPKPIVCWNGRRGIDHFAIDLN